MPANVSPEFKQAREAFRRARNPTERLSCLEEMLRTLPKHKGSEHLQADIRTRIKELRDELAGPKKGRARTGPVHSVRPEGAAQVALLGPPGSGKSSLHARLTGSHAGGSHAPLPGMFPHEDIQFQLVDLPPVSAETMDTWLPNALQTADAVLLVVDLGAPGCAENVTGICQRLDAKRVSLVERWPVALPAALLDVAPEPTDASLSSEDEIEDAFRVFLPTLLLANKSDLTRDRDELALLEELVGVRYAALWVSAQTGEGLGRLGTLLFSGLGVVRVYTKIPGHEPDHARPYTIFRGGTVADVARMVHRELAESLAYARIWGSGRFDGQRVGRDHVVADGDVVELHG